tara:strand:+ start:1574 stop:1888 length:315 start_codon:yes stop_codon:yes gene_type:complete
MFLDINNRMARVIQFPKAVTKPKIIKGYKMAFYTDQEIDLALLCLNTFGWERIRYDRIELKRTDPMYIKKCLILGYNSQLLSHHSRKLINKIIDSITEYSVTAT